MEFRDPILLWLGVAAPIVLWLSRRYSSAIQFSSLSIFRHARRTWRVRMAHLPAWLMTLAVIGLVIALAGPRVPDSETRVTREGIAIMAVIDRSDSMQARDLVKDDLSVDRLAVVKEVFRQFVLGGKAGRGRPDDMIGLVSFAGYADSLCPLTLDHGNLVTMSDDLDVARTRDEGGTALGDGLALAVERIRQSKAKSRVIILLTDGVNNTGAIDPTEASELAASQQIKVYCIGAGTNGTAPFPMIDPFSGRQRLQPVTVEIDEKTLRLIADKTGGKYFRATDKESLTEIYAEIDRLERTQITEIRYLQYTEHYASFVIASLCCVMVAVVSRATLFRTLP